MAKTKNRAVYRLEPGGLLDRTDPRIAKYAGREVQVVQPPGTPRNGTMGQCYIQTLEGEFIGLVGLASLVKTGKTAPVRDLAAEARDARSARLRSEPSERAALQRLKGRL